MNYQALAFYKLVQIEDPDREVRVQKDFFKSRDMSGRIYIASDGINAQVSGSKPHIAEYIAWLKDDPRFADAGFKLQDTEENVFPRTTIKHRPLVGLDQKIDFSKGADHVKPKQWRQMLEEEEVVVLDIRNDFEWDVGHFKGAIRPECKTFREFPEYAQKLAGELDPKKTKVMMYCTGGIRCEFFSPMLKEQGFENVYQLEGGVIEYCEKEEGKHWQGKLFVFDDRLTVDCNSDEVISECHKCGEKADEFFNCANMECNKLFISCQSCLEKLAGCCQEECQNGAKVRPLAHQMTKPFRKWYHYFDGKK